MSDKAQSYAHLAEETAESLTKSLSNWTGFLTTVGRIYKYPYHEQLMIYAQRPDATACADYELWNNKMNRYVRRGSKGIALLDDTGDRLKLKYVFDVSDTGGRGKSRYPFLWEMQEYYKDPILEMLKDRYDTEGISIADALYNIAKDLAAEYYEDHKADIEYLTEGSFLEDYDEDNIRVAFEDAATVSIAYTLIKRCGLDTEEYFDHEDFLNIFDFNTADAVAMLGTAISEQSEQVLRQIALTIAKIERERSKSHERTNLQQERGLSDTRPHTDRADGQQGTALGQIRQNEEKVPTGTQNTVIPFPAPVREVVPTSTGNRPDSQQTVRADNGRLAESADTARQEEKSDGLGGTHEQSESTGGGNDTDRAHIQLSLFPSEEEQKQRIAESKKPSAFSLPLEENEQLSFEPKQEELLADWLVRFFNSLPTKYKGTFEIGKVELKKWKHIRSKEENLMITITSTLADYGDNSFTQFNKDKTDERIIHEAIDNSYLLTQLSKDKDFSISLSPSSIYIFYHKFKHKHIDFSLAEQFDDTTQEPTASVPDHEPQADSELISDTADAEIETPAVTDPQAEIPPQAQQSEPVPIPFSKGDTVYLENGTPFIIEEITDHKVSLRDPTLFYPIWRAESRESFLRLLERYPQSEAPQEQEKAENFRIADNHLGEGSKREKFARNIAAITTLQTIEREHRTATNEEQEILSQYIGWGGLSEAFDKDNSSFSSEYTQLKSLLSDEEYSMARASTLNAHYTTPVVIRAIYEAVEKMGFETGNILEPACGTGNFFGMLPNSMQGSRLYGIELDSITGRIAKQLYPHANIAIAGFEKTDLPDNFFDLAIGNVPFGNYKLSEKRYDSNNFLIHDHFFAKALDKVRPGGVVAFITSKGTLDKQTPDVRRYLAQRAELLGAIRLPNNAFLKNAGTEVTSDIIFLQKRDRPIDVDRDWIHLDTDMNGITLNSYFADHPEMILGKMEMKSGQFGMESTCTPIPGSDLAEQLKEAIQNIEGFIPENEMPDMEIATDTSIPADPAVKNHSYTLVDGEVYYRENSRMVKPDINQTAKERIAGMVELRECVNNLIHYQLEDYSEETIKQEQKALDRLYDAFTAKYGLINSRGNSLAFSDDNSYYLLCSLENIDENGNLQSKADMFTKRTIKKRVEITSVDTASEALTLSIAEKAKVDMAYMGKLTGLSEEQLAEDLKGIIFPVPMPYDSNSHIKYVTADEYLSGNVREKLRTAKLAAQSSDRYISNVKALEAAQPKDLDASEIDVRLGTTWIDKKYVEQFMYEVFDTPYNLQEEIEVKYAPFTAEWNITNKNSIGYNNVAAYVTYGTDRANAYRILEDSLNLRDIRIYDTITDPDGKERRVLNKDATTLAQQKQQAIKDEFRDWIWKDADRRQTLVREYNEKFNSIRPREYDGKHINFVGMNPEITLRIHQVNAIAHILYGDNTLLAHEVGAGKTYEMVAAAMESKRLGLCQKPLFAVPNHLTEQWASEFLKLYPAANILVATRKDFEKANRKKFCSKIATGDYDAVIMGHSQFERIPMSIERQERLLNEQIDEIIDGIEEVKASGGERFTVKQLERTKKSLEQRLEKLQSQERKDNVITFEQLGVDRLYVDEAHNYKNLFLYTKMRNVAGLSTTDAQKSSDMFMKCHYMDELTGGKGIVFATGTPVSNSMTELYTMQRYLQYNTLQRNDLAHFDSWASTFGETVTAIELAPEGTGYRARTRFSKFFNLPELMAMFKEVADIKTADQLNLPTPKVNFHTIAVQPTEIQQEMVKDLSERAAEVHSNRVEPTIDNMLKITSDGRKLGLDQRVVNPLLPDDENSKVNACVDNLYRIWNEGSAKKLTQLVFCDISTPKNNSASQEKESNTANSTEIHALKDSLDKSKVIDIASFSVYNDIRKKLTEKGIPKHEIAFIHEATTETKKKDLFAKVRSGEIRVLIGSTAKCGAGTNIQDRLIAIHDLDCPWRPGDLIQRLGRGARQGNMNPEIDVYRYVTEATFDAYLWQTIETKQRYISQIMTSKNPVRSCEDIDEAALSYAEIKALCAGNPKIKEKMDLDIEVSRLKLLKANHQSNQYRLEDNLLKYFPENIEKNKGYIKAFEQDLKTLTENTPAEGEFLPMTIKGDKLTDKDNAGAALLEACKEVKGKENVEIGSYRGFTMLLSYDGFYNEFQLTLKGAMSHTAKLGMDSRGNLIRIDNALSAMPNRMKDVTERLDNLYKQQDAAKLEMGKPFLQEQELKDKVARLAVLDAELNMGVSAPQQSDRRISKSERPSVLDSLKQPPQTSRDNKEKQKIAEVR